MNIINSIKDNFSQIAALVEKNLKLEIRFKFSVVTSFISPIIGMILPLIVMGKFLSFNVEFGPWNETNFAIYQFVALNLSLIIGIRHTFPAKLNQEKFWRTLSALIIAPFNRINLLFGIFFSHIILISIPFAIFFIICYLYYPVSFITILAMIGLYLLLALVFSGIGLILAIFAISNENIWTLLSFLIRLTFFVSCVSYPFELFPNELQQIINLNPLYYIFDFMRLAWIEDNIIYSITAHSFNFFIIIASAILLPLIGVYIFNKVYAKYGIVGY